MIKGPSKLKKQTLFLYLLPSIVIFVFVVVIPLFLSVRFSFYKWSGGPKMTFIGLQNYANLIMDGSFWLAFKNNLSLVILALIGQVGFPLLLTVLFTSRLLKFKNFFRAVIFVPVVLSPVVIGILWSLIYNKDMGLMNWFLEGIGLGSLIRNWLDDPKIVMYSVSFPLVWQYIGVYLVIFMSAIQGIPQSILESAELDGSTGINRLINITLPLIKDTIAVSIMLCISGNMKVFDHIYVLTGGGPGNSSTVMAQYAYTKSFEMFKLGYGSSASVMILFLSMTLVLISRLLGRNHK